MLLAVAALEGGEGRGGVGEEQQQRQQQQKLEFVIAQKLATAFTILHSFCRVTLWQETFQTKYSFEV